MERQGSPAHRRDFKTYNLVVVLFTRRARHRADRHRKAAAIYGENRVIERTSTEAQALLTVLTMDDFVAALLADRAGCFSKVETNTDIALSVR